MKSSKIVKNGPQIVKNWNFQQQKCLCGMWSKHFVMSVVFEVSDKMGIWNCEVIDYRQLIINGMFGQWYASSFVCDVKSAKFDVSGIGPVGVYHI